MQMFLNFVDEKTVMKILVWCDMQDFRANVLKFCLWKDCHENILYSDVICKISEHMFLNFGVVDMKIGMKIYFIMMC